MDERDMVMDALASSKASLATYAHFITETADDTLRRTWQQMRDSDEKSQYELYKLAEEKGYYIPSSYATKQEMTDVKEQLQSMWG